MNKNGAIKGLRRIKPRGYEVFDQLPREYKELIWYGISGTIQFKEATGLAPIEDCKQQLEKTLHASCLATYGPDHPQAYAPKLTSITLEDLGL